jgi:hypothetical protein
MGQRAGVMNEKRQFQRVRFRAKCSLSHNNITYLGQLENISVNGALISFNDGIIIPNNDRCMLKIYLDGKDSSLRIEIEVIHSDFTMVGIRFIAVDDDVKDYLSKMIACLASGGNSAINEPLNYCMDKEG